METKINLSLKNHQYINLETYRKTGEAVQTPVWFVLDSDKPASPTTLYIWTLSNSGKAKRIRRTGKVRLAPSDARGKPLDDWLDGEAFIADASLYQHGNQLMNRKYGLMKKMFELFGNHGKTEHVIIAIQIKN